MAADAIVLGAGVSGLTTAVSLAEAGLKVEVVAAEVGVETTSVVAAALCGPVMPNGDERHERWSRSGDEIFRGLADDPVTGVRVDRGRLVSKWGGGLPPWAAAIPGFEPCTGADAVPEFETAFWVQIPVVDMRVYLGYLQARLEAAGGIVQIEQVASLDELADRAPLVVNCTGAAARHLTDDEDISAVKGQHVIVANPGLTEFLYEGGGDRDWVGFIPHPDRVVLSGVARPDDWDRTPDPEITAQILARCVAIEPLLVDAEVLGVEVGLRPGRSAVRLEEEQLGAARLIHNYGHGGEGVMLSWGSANDVRELVLG